VTTLAYASTPTSDGDHYRLDVEDGWQQGRGAFGGLVLAALTRAMEHALAQPETRLRSLTAELPAPTGVGPAEIHVEILRRGSSMTTAASRLVQGGVVCAHAVGVFGAARAPVRWQTEAPPLVASWDAVPVAPTQGAARFARHFEYRPIGPLPFTRASEARCTGWIRACDPGAPRDAGYVVAMADAYWPAALAVLAAPRPMATVAFTLELIEPIDDLDPGAPLLHRAYAPAAVDGFTFETRELWGADGRLVARNHQIFVVIK
jgi:acyl-CoA thioesterase